MENIMNNSNTFYLINNKEDMDEMLRLFLEMYESAEEGEENAHNIKITEDMSPEDVAKEVLNILEKWNDIVCTIREDEYEISVIIMRVNWADIYYLKS